MYISHRAEFRSTGHSIAVYSEAGTHAMYNTVHNKKNKGIDIKSLGHPWTMRRTIRIAPTSISFSSPFSHFSECTGRQRYEQIIRLQSTSMAVKITQASARSNHGHLLALLVTQDADSCVVAEAGSVPFRLSQNCLSGGVGRRTKDVKTF